MATGSHTNEQIERAIDRLAGQFAGDRVAAFGQLRVIARVNGQTLDDASRDVLAGRTRIEVMRDTFAPHVGEPDGAVHTANGHRHEHPPVLRLDANPSRHARSPLLRHHSADEMLRREQEHRRGATPPPWRRVGGDQP